MELAAGPIHSLSHMIIKTCQINIYPAASVVGLCLIYKLEKLSDQQFYAKLWLFSQNIQSWNSPYIWNSKLCYSALHSKVQSKKLPSPSGFQDATCGVVWIFSGNSQSNHIVDIPVLGCVVWRVGQITQMRENPHTVTRQLKLKTDSYRCFLINNHVKQFWFLRLFCLIPR